MPRGKYDRSKTKKINKSKTEVVQAQNDSQDYSSRDERLTHLERCAGILQSLSGINTQVAYEARIYIAKAVHEIVSSMLTTGPVTATELAPVEQAVSTASITTRLKKDGTPRLRPGPKPKVQAATQEHVTAQNTAQNGAGNGKVFNPEHAGQ